MTLPTDEYGDLSDMTKRERRYVEAMRAAVKPGLVESLVEQIEARAAASLAIKRDREPSKEPPEWGALDGATTWMHRMVDIAYGEAHRRMREREGAAG